MSEPSEHQMEWKSQRDKIIGLGASSTRKSYYPELQQRLAELKESEARFRTIYDSVNDAISVHDPATGKIVDVNQRMRELFGYTQDEAVGLTLGDLSSGEFPYDAQAAQDLVQGALEIKPRVVVWHSKDRLGRLFWSELSLRRMMLRGEERVLVMTRDITERKAAEEALRASERRLAELLNFLPDATFAIDTEGRVTLWNRAVETLTGVQAADIIGKDNHEHGVAFYGKQRPMLVDMLGGIDPEYAPTYIHIERQGQMLLGEWFTPHVRPGGAYLWGKAGPLFGADGNVIGFIETVRDITERKRTEDALRDSQRTLSTLMSNIPGMAYRSLNDPNWTMLFVSEGCMDLTGYPSDALIGNSRIAYADLINPDDRDMVWQEVQDALAKHCAFRITYRIRTAAGSEKWVWEQGCGIFAEDGNLETLEGLITDITERKRAEEEKRAFYRETIFNATDGKLTICDDVDVSSYRNRAQVCICLREPSSIDAARRSVEQFSVEHGLKGDRFNDFMIGVGEAIANALKHCGSGYVYAGAEEGTVWVGVGDAGSGIESLVLPRAVLRRGFSTKPSLGLGYSIMLQVADQILLSTGKTGTNVVLIENLKREPEVSLDSIPDTWPGVADIT